MIAFESSSAFARISGPRRGRPYRNPGRDTEGRFAGRSPIALKALDDPEHAVEVADLTLGEHDVEVDVALGGLGDDLLGRPRWPASMSRARPREGRLRPEPSRRLRAGTSGPRGAFAFGLANELIEDLPGRLDIAQLRLELRHAPEAKVPFHLRRDLSALWRANRAVARADGRSFR